MISKVIQYNSTPTVVSDYQAQNAHLQAMINKANGAMGILKQTSLSTIPTIAQGGYISMGGTLYVVDTEDYIIQGTAIAGLNYIRLGVSGDNLVATWVQDISTYSWNAVYNYYTNGTNALLPYVIKYDTNYYVSRFDQTINQQLKRDSDVVFNSVRDSSETLLPTNLVKKEYPNLIIEGEIQPDAAVIPTISIRKNSQSKLKGKANILIFPDLNSGNIAYKLVERIANANAFGPLTQGIDKPVNDLSRGCSVEDIVTTVALTAAQINAN